MTDFVLVHGSWHDGSSWGPVIETLQSLGHAALAPTSAGHGKQANKRVSHTECWRSVADYIVQRDLSDFVLVGHSFGGTVIAKVAETMPERIRRLVFWNAFVLPDGRSLSDETPPHYRETFARLAVASGDDTIMLPFNIWRENFINDGDDDMARTAYDRLSPEPARMFNDKVDMKRFYSLDIPRSYLNCTEDIALPPGEFGWFPRMFNRLGLCRLVQMPGSHEAMFTNPAGLARKLVEAGRD